MTHHKKMPDSGLPCFHQLRRAALLGLALFALAATGWSATAPVFTTQPVGATRDPGTSVTFSVETSGTLPMTYQWRKNGTNMVTNARVTGVTSPTLKITGIIMNDAAQFSCRVTDGGGQQATSNNARLIVNPTLTVVSAHGSPNPSVGPHVYTTGTQIIARVIGTPEVDTTGTTRFTCTGWSGTGSVPASGSSTITSAFLLRRDSQITWNWQKQFKLLAATNPPGAGRITLADKVTTATNSWQVADSKPTVWVFPNTSWKFTGWSGDASGTGTSASLTMSKPLSITANFVQYPVILKQPVAQGVNDGTTATFTVVTTSTQPMTYQWQKFGVNLKDGGNIAGATSSTLTIGSAHHKDEGQFRCVITNAVGTVQTNQVALTINHAPTIRTQPASRVSNPGTSPAFVVVTSGTQPIYYQWKKNGVPLTNAGPIHGADTSTLVISPVSEADQGIYSVYIQNMAGSLESTTATLMVNDPPVFLSEPADQRLNPGVDVSFSVVTTGTAPLTHIWLKDGILVRNGGRIAGATSTTLTIHNVTLADIGSYQCQASNMVAAILSRATRLDVNPVLQVSSAHGRPTPAVGVHYLTSGTLVNASTGIDPDVDTTGTTRWVNLGWTGTGSVPGTGITSQTSFILDRDSTLNWQWKTQFALTAASLPPNGGVVTLRDGRTSATGTWYDPGQQLYVRPKAARGWVFRGWGGDAAASAMGTSASLVFNKPLNVTARFAMTPVVLRQPYSQTINSGSPAALDTLCTGTATLQYQWLKDGVALKDDGRVSGTATARLRIGQFSAGDVGNYACRISNEAGAVDTRTVQLKINFLLHIETPYGYTRPPAGDNYYSSGTVIGTYVVKEIEYGTGIGTRYVCSGWRGAGAVAPQGIETSTAFRLDHDTTLTWNWKTEYLLQGANVPAEGGVITPGSNWYAAGSLVTLQAVPDPRYDFTGWSGDVSGHSPMLALAMDGPRSVTANYVYAQGSVRIAPVPATAGWTLIDSKQGKHSGVGSALLTGIPCGTVQLTWTTPPNYLAPGVNPIVRTLVKNTQLEFTQIFIPDVGVSQADYLISRILRYLLGLSSTTTDLDLNGDGKVTVADLLIAQSMRPPTPASTPSPLNSSTGVPVDTALNWSGSQLADSYAVYLWKVSDPQPLNPTTSGLRMSYYRPSTLAYSTVYQWIVVSVNDNQPVSSPVWSFTTKPQPLHLLSPNGGETLRQGTWVNFHWKSDVNQTGRLVDIELWRNGKKVAYLGHAYSETGESNAPLFIPTDIPTGGGYRVRAISPWVAENIGGPDAYDESDGTVTIAP